MTNYVRAQPGGQFDRDAPVLGVTPVHGAAHALAEAQARTLSLL
jgi:hypothetical protein